MLTFTKSMFDSVGITFGSVALVVANVVVSPGFSQIPRPPVSEIQKEVERSIIRAFKEKNINIYQGILSENVIVSEDGKVVANNKKQWLEKLVAQGVIFDLPAVYHSNGRILTIEYFNSSASWGGRLPSHCCWSYDAVSYDIVDGKVRSIKRLRGGDKVP